MPASKSAAIAGGESEAASLLSPTVSEAIAAFRTPSLSTVGKTPLAKNPLLPDNFFGLGEGGIRVWAPDMPVIAPVAPVRPLRKRQVFIAYPYGSINRKDYRGVFTQLGRAYDVNFVYADEKLTNRQIAEKIRRQIEGSDFSLFDISGWNANVAFELGIAYEMGPNWYICFNPKINQQVEVPSNIRGLDRVQYCGFDDLQEKLTPLMEQWYPPDTRVTLNEFEEKIKDGVIKLLGSHSDGLPVKNIAEGARINLEMAQVVVRQLKKEKKLIQVGKNFTARYRLKKTNGPAA